jgi:hypothetical protein
MRRDLPACWCRTSLALLMLLSVTARGAAQTTQVLNIPDSQITDTTIRNGSFASSNLDNTILLTRSSTVPEWERRTIVGVDTATIPANAAILSATLTLTVKAGLGTAGSTRPVTPYRLTTSFAEREATWLRRLAGQLWLTPGGDLAESYPTRQVTNTVRARINFDLTALVQRTVNNEFDTRQVRLALVDVGGGGDAKESYREYFASEVSTPADRPVLTIVYDGTLPPPPIDVPAGADLQQVLNQVVRGQTIRLAAGATYIGNFTLRARSGTDFIVITTGGVQLPSAGTRIDPTYRGTLATIRSSDGMPAISTDAGASYYRIVGVAFEANVGGTGDIIALGSHTQTTLAEVPHHFEIDRVLITGDAAIGQKRGISANAAHVSIVNSDIREIKASAQDSQAIAAWNTPGPITIANNRLEAAGENILFGGTHVALHGVVPSDILVERNLMTKNPLWRGAGWTVKNIFELKSARRVLVRNNTLEYNWSGAQPGYAIVLTPRNSSGRTPWVVIEDVEFSGNVLRHSGGAFNILGHDDTAYSGQLARLLIRDNLLYDISSTNWGGSGAFAQIGGEPRDITIDHNTVMHSGSAISFYLGSYINASGTRVTAAPVVGFVFTNNMLKHNAYGIFGSGQAYGNGTLAYYAPGAIVRRNVLGTDKSVAYRYPPDNFFPSMAAFIASFVNYAGGDYRLVSTSPYIGAGTDGRDVGCTVWW